VFFTRRGRRRARIDQRWSEPTAEPQSEQLEEWRRSAQRVRRTWNAWLAADGHERRVWYRAFVAALAEEERAAAEVERMIEHAPAAERGAPSRPMPLTDGHVGSAAEPEIAGG
jgi:hypothetical protein